MKVKISLGALSNPISLVKRSSEQFFVFALAHLEGPPPAFFLFQLELQIVIYNRKTAKNLFTEIQSSRNVLQSSSYHC